MQRLHHLLWIIFFVSLTACAIVPSPQVTFDKETAITHSYNLLLEKGLLKVRWPYDNVNYAALKFPNGEAGAFVAMGFCCPAHGHQFLYRFHGDQIELVQLLNNVQDWGLRTLSLSDKVDIEFLELYQGKNGKPIQVLKVTGASHTGSGLGTEGDFQLVEITDAGLKVVFTGAELSVNGNNGGHENKYNYQFTDVDGDGNKEIIQAGEACSYEAVGNKLSKIDCRNVEHVYHYNGAEYVRTP